MFFLQNLNLNPELSRRNLLHEKWYYNLLKNMEDKIEIPNFLADLYTKEFNNYDEVIAYINSEFGKSIWTKDIKVSWNKRFVSSNFLSVNSNDIIYRMNMNPNRIQISNFINLDLKFKGDIFVKATLLNLHSKNKISNDFRDNFSVLDAFNKILSVLSFQYINALKTQQEFIKVLNAIIFKTFHYGNEENPNIWLTELLTNVASNANLSDLEIRTILLSEFCNDEITKNFLLLRDNTENYSLIEGENILKLKIAPNESVTENNWIDYDLLINWSEKKENYHYQHEILHKYIIDLGNGTSKLKNNKKLTEKNIQSDLLQTIVEDINDYYQKIKNNEFPYFLQISNIDYCKKDIFLICCKNEFFDSNLPKPIKFLNPTIALKKGNNIILVEISLDNYTKKLSYSIDI